MSQSSSKKLMVIVAGLAVAIAIAIVAWLMARRPAPPADRTTRVALMSMRSDLTGLVMAEESTKRLRGHYVSDPETAGQLSSPGVAAPVITLSDSGWSATVQHKMIPGLRCAVGVYARNPLKRFAKNGEIVCD